VKPESEFAQVLKVLRAGESFVHDVVVVVAFGLLEVAALEDLALGSPASWSSGDAGRSVSPSLPSNHVGLYWA
jgi:hypothetical protein